MNHYKPDNGPTMFLSGLILGSLLTALLTPRSGEEMRHTIADTAHKIKKTAHDKTNEVRDKTSSALRDLKQTATDSKMPKTAM